METAVWELGIILKPCHIFGEHFVAHIKLLNDDAYWDISKLFPPPITHPNPRGKNVNCHIRQDILTCHNKYWNSFALYVP